MGYVFSDSKGVAQMEALACLQVCAEYGSLTSDGTIGGGGLLIGGDRQFQKLGGGGGHDDVGETPVSPDQIKDEAAAGYKPLDRAVFPGLG